MMQLHKNPQQAVDEPRASGAARGSAAPAGRVVEQGGAPTEAVELPSATVILPTVVAGLLAFTALLLAALLAAGCVGDTIGCRDDGDCAGQACVAGQCRPFAGADLAGAGVPDLGPAGPTRDLATPIPDGWSPDALAAACTFNGDGVLDRSEAPFIPGLGGLFAVNASGSTVAVNLNAQNGVWDFSAPVSGETKVFDQLLSPGGTWWAADFPTATHAERVEDGQAVWGVYRATSTALQLLGLVSDDDGLTKTELTYATPIDVLRFPLHVGDQWTSDSDVTGTYSGAFFAAHETYTFVADQRGTTKVAAGSFDTIRLRTNYQQVYGFLITTRVMYLHLAECYGAVARVRSQDDESSNDFSTAAEYRRLATP